MILYGIKPSDLSTRFVAHLIDISIVWVIFAPLALLSEPLTQEMGFLSLSFRVSLFLIIFLLYFILAEGLTSTTPGKRAMGLRVVSLRAHSPITMGDSLIRNILRVADILTLYFTTIFAQGMRIGDLSAETVVVSKKLLRLEIPEGKSDIAIDLRRGILVATCHELMSIEGWEKLVSRLASVSRPEEVPPNIPSEVASAAFSLATRPDLASSVLGTERIVRIYERATDLCYHAESKEIIRSRVELIRALLRNPSRKAITLKRILQMGPQEFREIIPYFTLSILLFLASLMAAYMSRPAWLETILKELFGRGDVSSGINPLVLFILILLNNLRVVLTVVGSVPLIFLAPLVLVANGALVGLVLAIGKLGGLKTLGFILPHGVPELTAIFISTSIALSALKELLFPTSGGRMESMGKALRNELNALLLSLLLLVYAAFVEGVFTRNLAQNFQVALLFSVLEGIVIYAYLCFSKANISTPSPAASEDRS